MRPERGKVFRVGEVFAGTNRLAATGDGRIDFCGSTGLGSRSMYDLQYGPLLESAHHLQGQILPSADVDGFVQPAPLDSSPIRARDNAEFCPETPQTDQAHFTVFSDVHHVVHGI